MLPLFAFFVDNWAIPYANWTWVIDNYMAVRALCCIQFAADYNEIWIMPGHLALIDIRHFSFMCWL